MARLRFRRSATNRTLDVADTSQKAQLFNDQLTVMPSELHHDVYNSFIVLSNSNRRP